MRHRSAPANPLIFINGILFLELMTTYIIIFSLLSFLRHWLRLPGCVQGGEGYSSSMYVFFLYFPRKMILTLASRSSSRTIYGKILAMHSRVVFWTCSCVSRINGPSFWLKNRGLYFPRMRGVYVRQPILASRSRQTTQKQKRSHSFGPWRRSTLALPTGSCTPPL